MKEQMNKFRRRIIRGAILKSVLAALVIACGVLVVSALASWIFSFREGIWLSVGLFVATLVGVSLLFFFLKYRPTAREVARRIDATGLEERLITMMELEGDDSYLARMQREDTQKALAAADHTLIKVAASVALCVAVGISALLGVGALTVDSLYVADIIPGGIETINTMAGVEEYKVSYSASAKGSGKIYYWQDNAIGDEVTEAIIVTEGEAAPAVIAVPEEGFRFVGWSDGVYDPYRQDIGVMRNLSVRALFEAWDEFWVPADDGWDGFEGNPNSNSDQSGDFEQPVPPTDQEKPESGNVERADSTKVNNGDIYYGDEYNNAYQDAMDRLGGGSDIPENVQGGISDYMGNIGTGSSEGGNGSTTP